MVWCGKEREGKAFFTTSFTHATRLTNELGELVILIDEKKFDLTGITETWWEDPYDWNVKISICNLFRK